MTEDPGPHPPHPAGPHEHGHSVYEPGEFLGAAPEETIPEREVNLGRRFLNVRTIGSINVGVRVSRPRAYPSSSFWDEV